MAPMASWRSWLKGMLYGWPLYINMIMKNGANGAGIGPFHLFNVFSHCCRCHATRAVSNKHLSWTGWGLAWDPYWRVRRMHLTFVMFEICFNMFKHVEPYIMNHYTTCIQTCAGVCKHHFLVKQSLECYKLLKCWETALGPRISWDKMIPFAGEQPTEDPGFGSLHRAQWQWLGRSLLNSWCCLG